MDFRVACGIGASPEHFFILIVWCVKCLQASGLCFTVHSMAPSLFEKFNLFSSTKMKMK